MDIEEFTTLLVRSGLSGEPETRDLIAGHESQCREYGTPETAESFCDFLVATNLFTRWQCEKLLNGKWKGFYLDNYLILDRDAKDSERTYYKARDTRTGKLVRMSVRPTETYPGIEYQVFPFMAKK
jgi:hypothetical protein